MKDFEVFEDKIKSFQVYQDPNSEQILEREPDQNYFNQDGSATLIFKFKYETTCFSWAKMIQFFQATS